ncbi:MAG: AEC family transporter [Anditalea sp.]
MTNILLVIVSLIIGIFLQRIPDFPGNAPKTLNAYLIYIVLPAIAILYIPEITISTELILPVLVAWIGFFMSWASFGFLGKIKKWDRGTIGCLVITAGLANTSFIGIPIIEAIYGAEGLKIAILIDQPGSFILVSSFAIIAASIYSDKQKRKRDITKSILLFPPFLFFVIALAMNLMGTKPVGISRNILESFTLTLTPIALVSVGLQTKVRLQEIKLPTLWYGLIFKLVFIPLVIFLLYRLILGNSPMDKLIYQVSVMEAGMAPMISGSIIAISHGLNPKLASLMVGIGIPLSFLTLTGWYFLMG